MEEVAFLFVWPAAAGGFARHLGASYIRAYLKARGVRTGQFIHSGNESVDCLAERMLEYGAPIIGFSCDDENFPRVRLLAERIRRFSRRTVIACGGPAATFSDRVILESCPSIDCCVRHEGESAALELLEWVDGERPIESIRGITYRSSQGVRRTPDRGAAGGQSGSLDDLPDPYLEGVTPAADAGQAGLVTSRGCLSSCTYCSYRLMSGLVRFHSLERVGAVLSFLDRELSGTNTKPVVPFHDDNLSLDRGRLHRLLRGMVELRFQSLRFCAMMRPDLLTGDSFALLRDAGFAWVHFGVESGSAQILGALKRVRPGGGEKDGYRVEEAYLERVAWAVDGAKRAGIGTVISVILGCPGETETQGRQTLEFVRRLAVDEYAHTLLQVRAGTELERTCGDHGIRVGSSRLAPLPPRTLLSYPAQRLPKLDNARPYPARTSDRMPVVMRLLTGAIETHSGMAIAESGVVACDLVLGMSKSAPANAVRGWLNDTLPYNTVVCQIPDGPGPSEDLQSQAWEGVPFEFWTLRSVPDATGGDCWRLNELDVDAPPENCMAVRSIPLAAVDWSDLSGGVDPVRQTLLMTAETAGDVEAMERALAACEPEGCWKLPVEALETCLSIADGCRWAGSPCPAAAGIRWFIGRHGSLSPCRCGGPVGEVGQGPDVLREAVERIERSEAEKRGCASCPASGSCSRCLFPEPLGAARFCEFRQRHPGLPAFVDGLVLARLLVQASLVPEGTDGFTIHSLRGRLDGEFALDGGPVPLPECVLLTLDGTGSGFLCHSRRKVLVSLDGEQLRTMESLLQVG